MIKVIALDTYKKEKIRDGVLKRFPEEGEEFEVTEERLKVLLGENKYKLVFVKIKEDEVEIKQEDIIEENEVNENEVIDVETEDVKIEKEKKDISKMKKEELLEVALEKGIEVPENVTKEVLINLIKETENK